MRTINSVFGQKPGDFLRQIGSLHHYLPAKIERTNEKMGKTTEKHNMMNDDAMKNKK